MKGIPNVLDAEFKRPVFSPVCSVCRHLLDGRGRTCAAFPGGIPEVIWNGQNLHQTAYPGDNGIRFAPFEDADGGEDDSQNST